MLRRHVGRGGFTVVELLIIIGIIAVLMALFLPALARARRAAKNVECVSNLRSNGHALTSFATQHNGKFPAFAGEGAWLWDLPFPTRDAIVHSGATRDTMYCPLNTGQNSDVLWNYPTYCVTGYFWLMRRVPGTGNYPPLNGKGYQKSVMGSAPAQTELVTDATVSQGGVFTAIQGAYPEPHSSNHVDRAGRPLGGNILYLDGHVEWRAFSEMSIRAVGGFGPAGAGHMEMWF
jgi:prepilin-type processing-associated H-X9-DG protein